MKLTILERITLAQVLPRESNYVTLKIINELRMELGFSEKEIKTYGIKEVPGIDGQEGQIKWNDKYSKLATKEVAIGVVAREVICESFKRLDKAKKINAQNSTLYEKFMMS